MKTGLRIFLFIVIGVFAIILSTCSLSSVSISDRISSFVSSLNGDRTNTYQNLDPSIAIYGPAATPSYWNTNFDPLDKPFSFSPNPPNTSNAADVEVNILGNNGYNELWKFSMSNVGTAGSDDWRIHNMAYSLNGGVSFTSIF